MAKWLKLYAIYTFSTKPDPRHYAILLNADVLNLYLTLDLLQPDCSDVVSRWRGHSVVATFLPSAPLFSLHYCICVSLIDDSSYREVSGLKERKPNLWI